VEVDLVRVALNLNNVTITGNLADIDRDGSGDGGGLFSQSMNVTLQNTIIAGNNDRSSTGSSSMDCAATLNSQGYNLIGNTTGCSLSFADPTTSFGLNPLLGPLQNNGGATDTHALLPGSPAIDAANPAAPGSSVNACETVDQRGLLRPQGAACDIGAFELQEVR
jgi:hypothetical protein